MKTITTAYPRWLNLNSPHNLGEKNLYTNRFSCSSAAASPTLGAVDPADLNPNNYCRTLPDAFERELRSGLESLIVFPNTIISVVAPPRVSQICKFQNLPMCDLLAGPTCGVAWNTPLHSNGITPGICLSLTTDCSDTRIVDAYTLQREYVDRMRMVVNEYQNITVGTTSKVVTLIGKTVGGATKAAGVKVFFSEVMWRVQVQPSWIGCCDCFHPSVIGQQMMANGTFNGGNCSTATPCCSDSPNPCNATQEALLHDALCDAPVMDGTPYPGIQLVYDTSGP